MKLYLDQTVKARGIMRVVDAMRDYAPSDVKFVDKPREADVCVYQIIGRLQQNTDMIKSHGMPYVLFQHAWKSTQKPTASAWMPLWMGARLVWSHYDLPLPPDKFHRSALGADEVFWNKPKKRKWLVMTTGMSYLTEGVRECIKAAEGVGRVLHLGPDVSRGHEHVDCVSGISDKELANLMRQCRYVCGLRRKEGFELPCVEGLFSGARPIFFSQPHYKHWFQDIAEYVPEEDRIGVEESLTRLFRTPERKITSDETFYAEKNFDWKVIIPTFYSKLYANS